MENSWLYWRYAETGQRCILKFGSFCFFSFERDMEREL